VQSKLEVTLELSPTSGAGTIKFNQTARTWHEQAKQLLSFTMEEKTMTMISSGFIDIMKVDVDRRSSEPAAES
jgi:hypothetical protein